MKTLKITKYLNYTLISDTGKTLIIGVGNNSGEKLGLIKWHGAWRKYCFNPLAEAIFDTECLNDIVSFINELMTQRNNIKSQLPQKQSSTFGGMGMGTF